MLFWILCDETKPYLNSMVNFDIFILARNQHVKIKFIHSYPPLLGCSANINSGFKAFSLWYVPVCVFVTKWPSRNLGCGLFLIPQVFDECLGLVSSMHNMDVCWQSTSMYLFCMLELILEQKHSHRCNIRRKKKVIVGKFLPTTVLKWLFHVVCLCLSFASMGETE